MKDKEQIKRYTTLKTSDDTVSPGAQCVKIKDWDYIQEHNKFISAVPDMEPFAGKEATIIGVVAESPSPNIPNIYAIFEDGGKYWWSQEWLENVEA